MGCSFLARIVLALLIFSALKDPPLKGVLSMTAGVTTRKNDGCTTTDPSTKQNRPEVFFINLDRSHDRRKYMESQLQFYGFDWKNRVKAVTIRDVVVPQEVSVAKDCLSVSNFSISYVTSSKLFNPHLDTGDKRLTGVRNLTGSDSHRSSPYKVIVTALCGRPKNSRRELIVTISHLQAIRSAIHSESTNPYALILEDDTSIAFETDFMKMAESAPAGFGILQLVTSNDYDVKALLSSYIKNTSHLWQLRTEQDYWCAGAYLINREVMRPYIDSMITDLNNGWTGIAVIAGYGPPCFPKNCCDGEGRGKQPFNPISPCVNAPRGYQSDHFLFRLALGRTYMSTVQLFTSAAAGNVSTLHQEHVSLHQGAFNRINSALIDMKTGTLESPSFVNKNCQFQGVARV